MRDLFENLNEEQKEAVVYNQGPLAIIAGAGSGKTRTITRKVAYLIREEKINPRKILAVAFTNKAANEMKERIINLVGPSANYAQVSTYHSLCVRILREDIDKLNYPLNFNIIDTIDQKAILKPAYKVLGLNMKTLNVKLVADFIAKKKFWNEDFATAIDQAKNDDQLAFAKLYKHYVLEQQRTKSLDFDDLILFTNHLFKQFPEVTVKWSKRFTHILADEFQDTSLKQYEIIKLLAPHQNITVVGDPDQTIFTWRRADSSLLLNFERDFKNAREIKLVKNYRSTPEILNAANKLIEHNKFRKPKELLATKAKGDIIEYFHAFSEDAEARWIAQKIQEVKKEKVQLKEIAIIFRANYLSAPLEKALIQENINYVLFGGVRFYQRKEIKDAISYLKIINNGDEISLRRMINVPARKIGETSLSKLLKLQSIQKISLWDLLINNFENLPLAPSTSNALAKFLNLILKYRSAAKSNPIWLVLEKFLFEVNYYATISREDEGRFESLKELINTIKEWATKNPEGNLSDYLQEISLLIDRDKTEASNDYVSLMTVHTAKGLEFNQVFVYGFSEGVFPSKRAIDEGGAKALEEERRLAYVAVTRAKQNLYLTSSRGFNIDHIDQKKPSRFLKELGIDYRQFTSEYIAPTHFEDNYDKNKSLIEGDKIIHEKFGDGIVVNIQGAIAEIAFKSPYGVKTMMKNHRSLKKVGE